MLACQEYLHMPQDMALTWRSCAPLDGSSWCAKWQPVTGEVHAVTEELTMLGDEADLTLDRMTGMSFNPLTGRWRLSADTGVNYIASFRRGAAERKRAPLPPGAAIAGPLSAEPSAEAHAVK